MSSIPRDEATSIQWQKGDLIGSGAFGRVYMGMNTESGELIAVKEAHTKVLQDEVRLLENLSHPKIVRYLGTEREDETLTILLEYVPGGSIQALLEKFGSFSISVIKRFTKQLLLGLEYLHEKGIIHGDIKAAISGSKPTRGTPYWMAPEVIRGTGHDFSADIWSVGCTVIEMATANPPWNQQFETVAAFFYCVGTSKSHPPIPEHLSSSAKDFLHECLQKEPTMRPSASVLLKHPFLTGKEVESQNVSDSAVVVGVDLEMHSSQGCHEVTSPIMKHEVEMASSFYPSYSEQINSTWSDHDANSNSISDPASGGTSKLIVKKTIKQVFSQIFKTFKRSRRTTRNGSTKGMFSYASILVATHNFSKENKLGQGGFGTVYKGKLITGQEVAVKRRLSKHSNKQFENEQRLMHELQHKNVIRILGFCMHGDERVLVYEYMGNRSLDYHLFGSSSDLLLDWNKRFNIIEGIAQGLVFLHKYSRIRIIHGDVKPSNVLLDEQMNPKIADFGLARILADNEETGTTNTICGTYGFISPEYLTGIFGVKSDVYSFGVLMLEIISGTKNVKADGQYFVADAWELWKKGAGLELMDQKLDDSSINKDQLLRCIHVGLLCVEENAADRPTMSDAISMLTDENVPLPKPTMPYPRCGDVITASIDGKEPETMSISTVISINSMSNSDFEGR
ncbi:hypothetical protein ABKV19_005650 [Rosa sericea]